MNDFGYNEMSLKSDLNKCPGADSASSQHPLVCQHVSAGAGFL